MFFAPAGVVVAGKCRCLQVQIQFFFSLLFLISKFFFFVNNSLMPLVYDSFEWSNRPNTENMYFDSKIAFDFSFAHFLFSNLLYENVVRVHRTTLWSIKWDEKQLVYFIAVHSTSLIKTLFTHIALITTNISQRTHKWNMNLNILGIRNSHDFNHKIAHSVFIERLW